MMIASFEGIAARPRSAEAISANTTQFAHAYLSASARLLDAVAHPSESAFKAAHSAAILAIGKSYCGTSPNGGTEWDLAQAFAKSVDQAARDNGFRLH